MRAFLVMVALAGCAHDAPPRVFGALPPAGCEHAASSRCVGWYLDRITMEITRTEYPDPALGAYVTAIGDRLARLAGIAEPLRFRVIDDLDAQAESWTGGSIYVHRGALLRLRSEAELAGLLGHEIGHAAAGHTEPGTGGTSARDRRDDEIQADEIAVRLVALAGYDPAAVETMLRAIAAEQAVACDDQGADHPCMSERIARVRALTAGRRGGDLGEARFRAATAAMVVGDDPLRASAVGRAVVFGHAGLALTPDHARELTSSEGHGIIVFTDDVMAVALPVPREFGVTMEGTTVDSQAFAVGPHGALWILVVGGPDPTRRAAALARQVRPIRADELAALRPRRFEPDAPRALWPPASP